MSPARGGRRNTPLAPLPDPVREREAEAEADRRARAALAAAAAGGEPLINPTGRKRSPITLPEYRRGRAPANKGKRYPAEILTAEEVQAIMAAMPAGGLSGPRNRALIVVLWRAGLRIAEALALLPKDVDPTVGTITVLRGKGAKRRVVGIDRGALAYFEAWMELRAKLGLADDAPLFCTISNDAGGRGRPLNSSSAREMLKRYARKAGVSKRVHPHGLRHTHAFELSIEDIPVHLIKTQLGHESLDMTQRYIDHLSPKQLINRLGSRVWPGESPPAPEQTACALSQGNPAPSEAQAIPSRVIAGEPPEPERLGLPRPAPDGEGAQRVLDAIVANGGSATQGQLRRALGLSGPTILKHVHRLHERGAIQRTGLDMRRSVIWKVAPPPVRVRRTIDRPHRRARSGEGAGRVLDALEALEGRASQAQLARVLGLTPHTIGDHCRELEAQGILARGGLDKSTSRRGSQVWRVRGAEVSWGAAGYTAMRFPAGSTITAATTAG